MGPLAEVEGHNDHHREDDGLFPQHGLDEWQAHEAGIGVDHAEAEGHRHILTLAAEEGDDGGAGHEIVDRVDEEHDAHVRQEGGIPRHLEGVNDDAGDDHIEQQVGHLVQARTGEGPPPHQNKAHRHHQKQRGHLAGNHQQIFQDTRHCKEDLTSVYQYLLL